MIEFLTKIFLIGFAILFSLFSFATIYALLRFGKSLSLGLVISAVYLIISISLLASTLSNFSRINFPNF